MIWSLCWPDARPDQAAAAFARGHFAEPRKVAPPGVAGSYLIGERYEGTFKLAGGRRTYRLLGRAGLWEVLVESEGEG